MKKILFILICLYSIMLLLIGCANKKETDSKLYKTYNNITIEIDKETGSRNIIRNGEYLYGISPENKSSNEELLKVFNLR